MKTKQYQPKTGQKCGCKPGQQRDNCPTCEGTGWVVDFAAIRARKTDEPRAQWITELLESLSDDYDKEAIEIDIRHNNFSPDRVEEYRHENIVRDSLINGQFTQAREQCSAYGLSYDEELAKFKNA